MRILGRALALPSHSIFSPHPIRTPSPPSSMEFDSDRRNGRIDGTCATELDGNSCATYLPDFDAVLMPFRFILVRPNSQHKGDPFQLQNDITLGAFEPYFVGLWRWLVSYVRAASCSSKYLMLGAIRAPLVGFYKDI